MRVGVQYLLDIGRVVFAAEHQDKSALLKSSKRRWKAKYALPGYSWPRAMPSKPSSPTMPPHNVLSTSSAITLALGNFRAAPSPTTRRETSRAAAGANGNNAEYQSRGSKKPSRPTWAITSSRSRNRAASTATRRRRPISAFSADHHAASDRSD